jgi:uncharacterized membrane protein YGL010W
MKKINVLLNEYGQSHQNDFNKAIHWICVPLIMFSLIGLLIHIPFISIPQMFFNWGSVALLLALVYYFTLSYIMFLGFIPIAILILYLNWNLIQVCNQNNCNSLILLVIIFIAAWIGQFIGHKIEGRKPSFLKDLQFLLIGPAWLLDMSFRKAGINF